MAGHDGDEATGPKAALQWRHTSRYPNGASISTNQQGTLTSTQIREAGIDDWRQILGRIKARFRTGDFATGLALVNKIGAAAQAADHHRHQLTKHEDPSLGQTYIFDEGPLLPHRAP